MNGATIISTQNYNVKYPAFISCSMVKNLKPEVPPVPYSAISSVCEYIKSEVFIPLAKAKSQNEFSKIEREIIPRFIELSIALYKITDVYYGGEKIKFENEIMTTLTTMKKTIEKKSKEYLEPNEVMILQKALFTTENIVRRSKQWVTNNKEIPNGKLNEELKNFIFCTQLVNLYLLLIFSIITGDIKLYTKTAVKISLNRLNRYITDEFYYAKKIGMITCPVINKVHFPKMSQKDVEEDKELAEAGISLYSNMLSAEDN